MKKNKWYIWNCIALFLLIFQTACGDKNEEPKPDKPDGITKFQAVTVSKTNSTQTYAHYMPWFESKETSYNGNWGQHWTMATRNPDVIDSKGQREIASYYHPFIDIYASSDPDLIEYHLLLMKYSGIDGVLIDWYGASDLYDYPDNRRNSEALIENLAAVGLKFAIVYEDRTISVRLGVDASLDPIAEAQADMQYLEDNYFSRPEYITIDNKPLLLVFGPEYFHDKDQWSEIFSVFTAAPAFVTLQGTSSQTSSVSSGEYIWVDANSNLTAKYNSQSSFNLFIGGAYPGFHDYYTDGGWGSSLPFTYGYGNGATLENGLNLATQKNSNFVQLITWNDFGEGTMIEPTVEFRFKMLEKVQAFAGVDYDTTDLKSIYDLHELRKTKTSDAGFQEQLDQAFYYFVSLQNDKAEHLIDSLKVN